MCCVDVAALGESTNESDPMVPALRPVDGADQLEEAMSCFLGDETNF